MSVVTVVEPTTSAVSVSEAKEHLVITDSDHDVLLSRLILAAERHAESYLGGFISTRTVELVANAFPSSSELQLPTFPIQTVSSVTYTDSNGDSQSFTAYREDLNGKNGKLVALNGWADTQENTPDAVKVRMVVGYTSVPEDIRHAILLKVAELFERREEAVIGASVSPSMNTFKTLLNMHRRFAL